MSRLRVALVLMLALALCACAGQRPRRGAAPGAAVPSSTPAARAAHETSLPQSQRYRDARDGGPAAPTIDVSTLVEPVPKPEPPARYGNKSPYSVLGQTYVVLPSARGYRERGIASWYGNKFHGYMTSSFEPYDMYQFSAAHKSLPLPSYVRVTNLENGKSVVVRVNDRGPFHENRLIDLSYAAAVRIGVWPKGTGLVEVRAIESSEPESEPQPESPLTAGSRGPRIYLQLGAFGERANAERVAAQAGRAGLGDVRIQTVEVGGRPVHRVRLGPLADVDAADRLTPRVERSGLGTPRVAIED